MINLYLQPSVSRTGFCKHPVCWPWPYTRGIVHSRKLKLSLSLNITEQVVFFLLKMAKTSKFQGLHVYITDDRTPGILGRASARQASKLQEVGGALIASLEFGV